MGKGKRNQQLRLEDMAGAPQKRQNKKQFVMPKWAKIAICAVLLVAIVGGIVAAAIINSGVILRNRVFIESKSGKFDLNQQMAAFILWRTAYQEAYYNYYYTSWGMYTDTEGILKNFLSANDYAVMKATSYTNSTMKSGLNRLKDYLSKMVASADAALEAGLKLEAHDKEEAKAYVEQLQMYYAQFRNDYANKYTEATDTNIWRLREALALESFQGFLELSVGDTFKTSDIEDAAELMIMYSKYTDYMSLELEDDATNDMLQDFILRHPEGHFKTEYFNFTSADQAMIRHFFTDEFMAERYEIAVAKYFASLDLNTSMTTAKKEAQLKALGMDTFTTYTKTVDADGNATYSNDLNEKIGEVVFNTTIKKNQVSVIADEDKVYLVYFNADSTATTATLSYKEYKYADYADKLPQIEGKELKDVIAECIKAGENTTDTKLASAYAEELLAELGYTPKMEIANATAATTTSNSKTEETNTVPTVILDALYDGKANVTESPVWKKAVTDADTATTYVVRVDAINKNTEGTVVSYSISYVAFKDDAFAALLRTFEEEFSLYLMDSSTDAPTYSIESFDSFKKDVLNWLLDEHYESLVLDKKANKDLDDLLALKGNTEKEAEFNQKLNDLFGENGVKCQGKTYDLSKELDSEVLDYVFNSKNRGTAEVIIGEDNQVYLVYVAPKADNEHDGHNHAKDTVVSIFGVKKYNFDECKEEFKIGEGENQKSYRDQIFADLNTKDREDTTAEKSSDDLAKEELEKFNQNEKVWPTTEELLPLSVKKPTSSTTSSTSIVPQAIINKIYPNGSSTTKVVEADLKGIFQVNDNGTSYLVKITQFPASDDKELTCKLQYVSFEDSEYYSCFRTIQTKFNSLSKEAIEVKNTSVTNAYQEWLFDGEYVEAKDGNAATHAFERKQNDITFIATVSSNKVTDLTIYIVDKAPEQVKDETPVVYGGYLSFATKKDAEKAFKQLQKCKTDFAILDKFITLKSVSKDDKGEEIVNSATFDFALKKSTAGTNTGIDANVEAWLFGERNAFDFEIVESADGKSYYLAVYVSAEGTSLRTARTDWIDEELTAHLDKLVKDGGYDFNAEAMAKIEDASTN